MRLLLRQHGLQWLLLPRLPLQNLQLLLLLLLHGLLMALLMALLLRLSLLPLRQQWTRGGAAVAVLLLLPPVQLSSGRSALLANLSCSGTRCGYAEVPPKLTCRQAASCC